jgi:hypothetical protein
MQSKELLKIIDHENMDSKASYCIDDIESSWLHTLHPLGLATMHLHDGEVRVTRALHHHNGPAGPLWTEG